MLSAALISFGVFAGENLLKSSGISPKAGWRTFLHNDCKKDVKVSFKDNAITIDIKKFKRKASYFVQLYTNTDALKQGKKYKVSFDINASKAGSFDFCYILGKSPYSTYARKNIKLEQGKKSYSCVLEPKKLKGKFESPRSMRFFLGNLQDNKLTISNIKVEEVK